MKNIIKYTLLAFWAALTIAACAPQEFSDYSLGSADRIEESKISFSQTPSTYNANVIVFTNTTNVNFPVTITWSLGNGTTSKDQVVTGVYPDAGTYTVSLAISSPDGTTAIKSATVVIENDDPSLLDTPLFRNLTGGPGNTAGKTWVFDQHNLYTKRVADATGKDIKGHMGLGDLGNYDQQHWGAAADNKLAWKLYDFKFTFNQTAGLVLDIQNNGEGYGRVATAASVGGFVVTSTEGDDALFTYDGGSYTFSLSEGGTYPSITLSGNAFMGYYCGSQVYDILYLDEEVMALRVANPTENQDWVFVYIREDLNVTAVKTPQAIPLFDDFEGAPEIPFVEQDMGSKTDSAYGNPAPVPINESKRVFLYEKSTQFYSNLSFTTKDYTFDLTTQNKIKMKVYIPSYNDYTTEGGSEDWITDKKLSPQIVVKLQDSAMGDNAWETQTEIVKKVGEDGLVLDKWVELEFDFSSVAARTDYDKIVIQFGAEGHDRPGIFFFDDFQFGEVEP